MSMTSQGSDFLNSVPELQNGDHLSRDEFERRYHAMPGLKKAELIEGVVYLPKHYGRAGYARARFDLIGWLGYYTAFTPGLKASANGTLRLDSDNEPQPDAVLFVNPSQGGQARIDEEGYLESAPELVADVAMLGAGNELHTKLVVYQRNRVRECIVWHTGDRKLEWFTLRGLQFQKLTPDVAEVIRSEFFPGLWLDVKALLAGDLSKVIAVLQQGLATKEHEAFIERWASSAPL